MDRLPKTALRLSPTLQYTAFLVVMLAVSGVLLSGLPLLLKMAALFLLLLLVCIDRPLYRFRRIRALSWDGSRGGWQIWVGDEKRAVSLRGETVMTRWWVSMNFVDEEKRRYALVLLPDSTSPEKFRLLRVILRHARL